MNSKASASEPRPQKDSAVSSGEVVEKTRLKSVRDQGVPWKKWGPYLSERQWGTVREDYSEDGDAWDYFTHDQARSRAYRWGEDGIAGISDDKQRLCFALALWNGKDPILKERLFGLTNSEGNHGEDVKEYYFYLDSTPTHSYMKYLYKYPQRAYPYGDLVETNRQRSRNELEYELLDTGVFDDDRYFDVFVEYAKAAPEDILVRITVVNRGPGRGRTAVLPTLWFRNDWSSWMAESNRAGRETKPPADRSDRGHECGCGTHPRWGTTIFHCEGEYRCSSPKTKRTTQRLFLGKRTRAHTSRTESTTAWCMASSDAVNPDKQGTKAAAHYRVTIARRPVGDRAAASDQPAASERGSKPTTPLAGVRRGLDRPARRRPTTSTRSVTPPSIAARRGQRDAPGHGRHAVEQAVLLLRR